MLGQECSIVYCSIYMAQASVWFTIITIFREVLLVNASVVTKVISDDLHEGGAVEVIQVQQSRDAYMSAVDAVQSERSELSSKGTTFTASYLVRVQLEATAEFSVYTPVYFAV